MAELERGDFTGIVEAEWITATLRDIPKIDVFETVVDDDATLERLTSGAIEGYIVARYPAPFMSQRGRNIASGEQGQPYVMSFTIAIHASNADDLRAIRRQVLLRLTGKSPSLTAGVIQMRGGANGSSSDPTTYPTRVSEVSFFRCTINV